MPELLRSYVRDNTLIVGVVLYIVMSSVLNATTGIDIGIPCLWNLLFDIDCPGCGLTTAFVCLLKLDFAGAAHANVLIFFVIPLITLAVGQQLKKRLATRR